MKKLDLIMYSFAVLIFNFMKYTIYFVFLQQKSQEKMAGDRNYFSYFNKENEYKELLTIKSG